MTCTIVAEFAGVQLPPCGRPAERVLTGRCAYGHTRTRPVCAGHAEFFAEEPSAVVCEQCSDEGREDMVMDIEWEDAG